MIRSLGWDSTTDEVLDGVDLAGKRVLVTGVSAGIGVETARVLVAHGAHVVGAVRDVEKGRRSTAEVLSATTGAGGSLELVELDLDSLASVRACAEALIAANQPYDAIICNAGIMACPYARTKDGFERQFGTNHLGHFLLVNRIADLVRPGGRVVSLTSSGHRFADVDLDDPNFERTPYDEWRAYGRSKTANVLFAVEFDRRHRDRRVRATAVHPGAVHTELRRYMTDEATAKLEAINRKEQAIGVAPHAYKSVQQGAATSVWAAFVGAADAVGGRYCEDCHVAEVRSREDIRGGVCRYALDADRANALWAISEELVGERF